MSWIVFFGLCFLLIENAVCQDLTLKGLLNSYLVPIDQKEIAQVNGKCYSGVGLFTCKPLLPNDDQSLFNELPYYLTIGGTAGAIYCLQCCGTFPDNIDTWDLYCPVSASTINQVNIFGYEARFARARDDTDTTIIRCPLRRSSCTYDDEGNTISCYRDTTYLKGYTLTLNVVKYNVNFKYWRGVESCLIETEEVNTTATNTSMPFHTFHEKIVMKHLPPTIPPWDYSKIAFFSFFFIVLVYAVLYFCRKKHCEYCGNKLILSFHLCYKCRWVGAKRPDPVLLRALEEKGELIQGKEPDKFPGLSLVVGFFRMLFVMVCCSCQRKVKVAPTKYDLALQQLESSPDLMESKIQEIEQEDKAVVKKKKKYKNNPNILEYDDNIIYEAVQHPKFIKG